MDATTILFLIDWIAFGLLIAIAFGYAVQDRDDEDDAS